MYDMAFGNARVLSSADVRALDRVSVKALLPDLRMKTRALRAAGLGAVLLLVQPLPVCNAPVLTAARRLLVSVFLEVPGGAGRLVGGFAPASGRVVTPEDAIARIEVARRLGEEERAVQGLLNGDADVAIALLSAATVTDPRNPDLWSDLSAAFLLRAGKKVNPDPFDRIRALQAADRAVALCDCHPEANFNLALALQDLHLFAPALEVWDVVLAGDLPRGWHRLAEKKREEATERKAGGSDGSLDSELWAALTTELAAPGKGEAALRALQGRAQALARDHGDSFFLDAVTHFRAALATAGANDREAWKQALSAYSHGVSESNASRQFEAKPDFAKAAAAFARLKSPLRWRAEIEMEMAGIYGAHGSGSAGVASLGEVSERIREQGAALPKTYQWLAARALWGQAMALGKGGQWPEALELCGEAGKIYESLGDIGSAAAMLSNRAEALSLIGRDEEAWADRVAAFELASKPGREKWMHNALMSGQAAAAKLDWVSLSGRLRGIALADARRQKDAVHAIEALVAEAREQLRRQRVEEARAALDEIDYWLADLPSDSTGRGSFDVELAAVRADLEVLTRPREALRKLEASVEELRRSGIPAELAIALDRASRAAVALGKREKAMRYADEAMLEVLRQAQKMAGLSDRRTLFAEYRPTLDRLVRLLWEGGRRERAFDWVLAAFESERTGGLGASSSVSGLIRRLALEPGQAVVIPFALDGAVLVGVALPDGTRYFRSAISDRDRPVFASLGWVGAPGASGGIEGALDPKALALLSEVLLGPVRQELESVRRLVFLPSPQLRSLPFAALYRPGTSTYLIEEPYGRAGVGLEISVAVPAGGRAAGPSALMDGRSTGLFVGNPRNAMADRLGMPELPGAETEVREASLLFPLSKPPLLKGEALKSFVVADLPRVDFAHLAVHTAPLRKGRGLLLASTSDGELNGGLLRGDEISLLDLHRLDLVVLAACRSAAPGDSVFAAEGLVEPFLEAGARAVIASPRAVPDSLSPDLWGPFYRELRAGRSPAAALRNAQLECLHSTDKDLANPAFWAGFAVYHGNLPMKGE